jgi:hypothetical protein
MAILSRSRLIAIIVTPLLLLVVYGASGVAARWVVYGVGGIGILPANRALLCCIIMLCWLSCFPIMALSLTLSRWRKKPPGELLPDILGLTAGIAALTIALCAGMTGAQPGARLAILWLGLFVLGFPSGMKMARRRYDLRQMRMQGDAMLRQHEIDMAAFKAEQAAFKVRQAERDAQSKAWHDRNEEGEKMKARVNAFRNLGK